MTKLLNLCETAMKEGRKIDLSNCNYGQTDGCCRFVARPTNYYYFLAGLVRTERLLYILESGTHWGGSIMSMTRGVSQKDLAETRFVTIDIVNKNNEGLNRYMHIKRILGDSAEGAIADEAAKVFDRPIDLFYIDSLHEYVHTKKIFDLYRKRLKPRYVILDDIRLTEEMDRFWQEVTALFGDDALDVSEIVGRRKAGFGIVRCRGL